MTDFSSLLSLDASKVEKPKPLPVGTYDCLIEKYELGESTNNKTPFCKVHLNVIAAGPDVDTDALADIGDFTKKKLNVTYWLTPDTLHRFKDLFENVLGMDITGKTFDELLPNLQGNPVKAEVIHQPSKDGESVYANVNRLLAS